MPYAKISFPKGECASESCSKAATSNRPGSCQPRSHKNKPSSPSSCNRKRSCSRELRSGVLHNCNCSRRNGLQDDCSMKECALMHKQFTGNYLMAEQSASNYTTANQSAPNYERKFESLKMEKMEKNATPKNNYMKLQGLPPGTIMFNPYNNGPRYGEYDYAACGPNFRPYGQMGPYASCAPSPAACESYGPAGSCERGGPCRPCPPAGASASAGPCASCKGCRQVAV